MIPFRAIDPYDWPALIDLLQRSFAYMEGRIDPPSSLRHLTAANLAHLSQNAEIWVIGTAPLACMILTPKQDRLYLGKLAVDKEHRGKGLARQLITQAEVRAAAMGLQVLELQTRIELVENHATFTRLGFVETARSAHEGYDHPTTLTFQKTIGELP